MSYLNLEHKILQVFKGNAFGNKFIVATSAGVDSLALLFILNTLKQQLNLELKVAHIHHGKAESAEQNTYRDDCYTYVKDLSEQMGLEFLTNYNDSHLMPAEELKSESDYRDCRERAYSFWLSENKGYKIALGHHGADLLENKLIHLIRGCGPKGFLSMDLVSENKVRPLLEISKPEIKLYVDQKDICFFTDPSNKDSKYLRNWIRNKWLPDLEEYRTGSVAAMSASLTNISLSLSSAGLSEDTWSKVYNATRQYLSLVELCQYVEPIQFAIIAKLLRLNNSSQFSRNQIKEVLKHLDTPQKEHRFKMLGLDWEIKDNLVFVSKY